MGSGYACNRVRLAAVLMACLIFSTVFYGCGGGGGGGATVIAPQYGSIEGYVYAPVGSGARVAEAVPAGKKAVQGATVSVKCGTTEKNTTTNSSGYFKIASLPAGSCTVTAAYSGFGNYQTSVSVPANSTATVGGSNGISLSLATSGSVTVTANVSGGTVFIDGVYTGVPIPAGLSHTYEGIAPGTHTVLITQIGYDDVAEQNVDVTIGQTAVATFSLNPVDNQAPVADAGEDAKWFAGTAYTHEGWDGTTNVFTPHAITYTLDGSGSSDPNGDTLTYRWEQVSGPSVALSDETASKPVFVPVSEGTYTFALSVSDGYLRNASDTVVVSIVKPSGKIAFESTAVQVSYEIYTMNADGSDLRMMTERSYDDRHPHWSPDGTQIAYSANNGTDTFMALINSDGTGRTITSIQYGALDWFNNGMILAHKYYSTGIDFYKVNTDGTGEQRLTNYGYWGSFTQISPDNTKILFSNNFGGDNYEIMVMDADGSNITRLTNNSTVEDNFAWLPDNRIVYTTSNYLGDRTRGLYIMESDGSNVKEIPMPAGVTRMWSNLTSSSDGQFIFFEDQNDYLHVMRSDGSASMSYGIWGTNPDYHPGP